MGKLTALKVKALNVAGRYPDGDGLYLLVKKSGSRSWMLRVQVDGHRRDFGLGSERDVTLADAREAAAVKRKLYRSGVDPVAAKREEKAAKGAILTFAQAAERAHGEFKGGWRNGKHQAQWLSTLRKYAFPALGALPVDTIDAGRIIRVLQPIWLTTPETARRVKQRIGTVLDWAYGQGFRETEAPMRAIGKGLKQQPKKDRHLAALPYIAGPKLMATLRERNTVGRFALLFAILTAARSGEVRGATWSEIDLEGALWTVPAERMKAGRQHVVPLSPAAITVIKLAKGEREVKADDLLFLGNKGKALSDMTLTKVLRSATPDAATVHGFRSTFRDWAAETQIAIPGPVVEAALAHTNRDRVEAAYRRTAFLDQRTVLMRLWADYLLPPPAGQIAK